MEYKKISDSSRVKRVSGENADQRKIKALSAESKAKTEFLANLIHDIRSPLTGIVRLASYLADKTKSPKEKHYAGVIHEGSKQLLDLINNVLDSGQKAFIEDKAIQGNAFNLSDLIEKLRELEEPAVLEHNLVLEVDIDSKIPQRLLGDTLKLERILLNLVSNAVKFTKEGKISINIRLVSRKKDRVHIEFLVRDTGVGIAEEEQAKVFKRYFKINAAQKANYAGNGLGLDIVQKYVRLLGGEVCLKSKVGKSTAFSFILAMKIDKESTRKTTTSANIKEGAAAPVNGELTAKKPRLLLVEDNHMVLMSMKLMMENIGIEPQTAVTIKAAIKATRNEAFDIIITDIELPDGSGFGLTEKIRSLEKAQNKKPIKIIGLTGHAVTEIINLCKNSGMDGVYQKPMDVNLLKMLVARAMKKKGRGSSQRKKISSD